MTTKTSAKNRTVKSASPALTREILNRLSDGLLLIDKDNQILYANEAAEKITGQTQLAGKHLTSTLKIAPPPQTNSDLFTNPIIFRIPNSDRDGTVSFLDVKGLPGIGRVHKKTKTAVILQTAYLERSTPVTAYHEILGHLTLRIAHDFNNALSSIMGNAEYLKTVITASIEKQITLPEDALSVAGDIIRKCQETAQTIDKLQDYARQQPRANQTIDLNDAINKILPIAQQVLGKKISLEFLPTEDLPQFYGEQTQIDQIIISLIVSSKETMPAGGRVTIQTEVSTITPDYATTHPGSTPGTFLLLTVNDTGIGIPKESLPQTFELFQTPDLKHEAGLRLPTAYAIVKQLSGYIDVESWEGQGTKFEIYLPIYSAQPSNHQTVSDDLTDKRKSRPGRKTRRSRRRANKKTPLILIAEDQRDVARTLSQHLIQANYRTKVAHNGQEALRAFKDLSFHHDRPAVVISDLGLPGIDGKTLCKQIQGISRRTHLVLTTGHKIDLKEGNTKTLDGFNFLQKPFTANTLIALISRILSNNNH